MYGSLVLMRNSLSLQYGLSSIYLAMVSVVLNVWVPMVWVEVEGMGSFLRLSRGQEDAWPLHAGYLDVVLRNTLRAKFYKSSKSSKYFYNLFKYLETKR